jgi:hypothetical protein
VKTLKRLVTSNIGDSGALLVRFIILLFTFVAPLYGAKNLLPWLVVASPLITKPVGIVGIPATVWRDTKPGNARAMAAMYLASATAPCPRNKRKGKQVIIITSGYNIHNTLMQFVMQLGYTVPVTYDM